MDLFIDGSKNTDNPLITMKSLTKRYDYKWLENESIDIYKDMVLILKF